MKHSIPSRVFAVLLAVVMVFTMLPTVTFAADAATFTRITSASELTTGKYVMVVDTGFAPGILDGTWITAEAITAHGDTVTTSAGVWDITVEGETVKLTDSNGVSIAPTGGNANGIKSGDYAWAVTCADGLFRFAGQGDDTVVLASNKGSQNKFRAYKTTTVDGNANGYPSQFTLYKLDEQPAFALVTSLDELVTGNYILVIPDGYAPGIYENGWLTAQQPTITEDAVEGTPWTITVAGDGTVKLTDANGVSVAPKGGNNNGINAADYDWTVSCENGAFRFLGHDADTVVLASNKASGYQFRAYKTSTAFGNPAGYPCDFTLYKINRMAEQPDPEEPALPVKDGDRVVVYNPANMKALSTAYDGFYNHGTDVTLADGKLSGFTAADVWTVGVNEDGSITLATDKGEKLAMADSFSSMTLGEAHPDWNVLPAATEGCYYIKNTVRGSYMEWYADKSNWSSYGNIGGNEELFAQAFYIVEGDIIDTALPAEGDQVVIYNLSAKGVLALQDDNAASPSINSVAAVIDDGKATAENGGVVFTVEKNGEYYRFRNARFGYLCSNGTGSNAFYTETASDDADWVLDALGQGYRMKSRTAKYNGTAAQYLEYYAGSYKTYSYYATNKDGSPADTTIYQFQFYPCANEGLTQGVVNVPAVRFGTLLPAALGQEYTLTFTVEAVFGVDSLTVKLGEEELTASFTDGAYTVVIPGEKVQGEQLTITVSGWDAVGAAISGAAEIPVVDEAVISQLTPPEGAQTKDDKRPVISAVIENAGENPTVTMTLNGEAVDAVYENGKLSYTPAADLADGRVTVTVTVERGDGKVSSKSWSFTVGENRYQFYFGQLHAHTAEYSDGAGKLADAMSYVKNLPDSANVDFVAITDHSNYFDTTGDANPEAALYDLSQATAASRTKWETYKNSIAGFNASQSDVVILGGFEMTWSGGPGHMNTFNTSGVVSRNNKTLNNKTGDAGMKAYYALLSQPEGAGAIAQFNHPGITFGTFSDFAYWDAVIDSRITLLEVGNGEGQIGAGGYFPSYEYYTMALDKGWHVAPTNNQDNHKGKWGNANDARDVILTDNFTEEGIYEALKSMRLYATEDKNLELTYTVNDLWMGSSITEVPEKLNFAVTLRDPDAADSISKVELVANSGKVAYAWTDPAELAAGSLSVTLDPTFSYYFVRVTQGDGDLAVSAPVWVGESLKLGVSNLACGTSTPVTGEELTLTTTIFNSENAEAKVKSITYTTSGDVVLDTDTTGYALPASGNLDVTFRYTPSVAKTMTITATVVVELEGEEFTFSKSITLDVLDAERLVYVGIDASHLNEYVAGNYKDSMGNFGLLAAGYAVRTVELKTSQELVAACANDKYKMVILTAPSRRDGSALRDPYKCYTDEEIQALVAFSKAGGSLVLAGWSDYYEHYAAFPADDHMAAQQNKLLAALGSSLRISDDATNDDVLNGGQAQRLYLSTYNFDSFLMDGVDFDAENPNNNLYSQLYSQYGGATIHAVDGEGNPVDSLPETVTPVVYGHSSTYSVDSDSDGLGGSDVPKYAVDGDSRLLVLATEELPGQGLIVVAGAAFMSNFEVQATVGDSGAEKNYSNYNICENLVKKLNPVVITDIAEVQAQPEEGYKYTIEGVVTSNASGYDKRTAFFDCIYLQDDTAGINAFPVAGNFQVGDRVRITGTTSSYQGERQIAVQSIQLIGQGEIVEPVEITAQQLNDGSVLGRLITLKGRVESFEMKDGLVQNILVRDAQGDVGRVFIDGYITSDKDVENLAVGKALTVTGLASYDNTFNAPEGPFPRIRVRDRADVVCTAPAFVDVQPDDYFAEAVEYMAEQGYINGTKPGYFSPFEDLSRGQMVAILYRAAGEPEVAGTLKYSDVGEDYYTNAIIWATDLGIATGHKDGTFRPDEGVTREEMVAFLYRFHRTENKAARVAANLDGFRDAAKVSGYAREAMTWAVENGLIIGKPGGCLAPQEHAQRCQAAMFLYRYLQTTN